MKSVSPPCEKRCEDGHADDRGQSGSQDGAEDAHPEREDEDIVQQNVGEAASDHRHHGELRGPVVPNEAQEHVVDHEHRGEEQQHLDIGPGHGEDVLVGPQHSRESS